MDTFNENNKMGLTGKIIGDIKGWCQYSLRPSYALP